MFWTRAAGPARFSSRSQGPSLGPNSLALTFLSPSLRSRGGRQRRQTEEAGLSKRLTFKRGDVEAMPFEDDSFDLVISVNTLHVVDDPVAMMNEAERVLRPDGALVLTCIRRSWLGLFMPILKTGYIVEEVKEILGRSKLRPWKLRDYLLWFVVEATG